MVAPLTPSPPLAWYFLISPSVGWIRFLRLNNLEFRVFILPILWGIWQWQIQGALSCSPKNETCVLFCFVFFTLEGVFFDEIDHALKNLKRPAAYAAKHKLPIIMWWTPFTQENTIKRCSLGECFFTEVRKFQTHPRTKAFMFYGTSFSPTDLPLPRHGGLILIT